MINHSCIFYPTRNKTVKIFIRTIKLNLENNLCIINVRNSVSLESSNKKMEQHKIADRLILHKPGSRDGWNWSVDPAKVLVIFFPWLGAREKHISKYRELYTELGLDVLTVKSKNSDFLWPPNSVKLARTLDKTLSDTLINYEHYLCHSMSAGAYNLTVLCMHSRNKNEGLLLRKFEGIVFDSVVVGGGAAGVIKDPALSFSSDDNALDKMIQGVATSFSSSKYFHNLVKLLANIYFQVTKKYTLQFYDSCVAAVRDEPVPVPTLVVGSKDDPLSDARVTERLVDIWRKEHALPVTLHLFNHSSHAQHYIAHKDEYRAVQMKFLNEVFSAVGNRSCFNFIKPKL